MSPAPTCFVSRLIDIPSTRPLKARREPNGDWIVIAGNEVEYEPPFTDDPSNWRAVPLRDLLDAYPSMGILADEASDEIEWDPIRASYVERSNAFTCCVSRCVFEPGGIPRYARRVEPVHERDSGWSFLAGAADEEANGFGDVATNWRRPTLADLIERFRATEGLFGDPVGTELEWDPTQGAYQLSYVL